MRFLLLLSSYLLVTTTLCIFSHDISSSSSPSSEVFPTVRRSMREKVMSSFQPHRNGYEKTMVPEEATEQVTNQKDSEELEYLSSIDHADELHYHIDYRGVTTHPNPTPKHPRP